MSINTFFILASSSQSRKFILKNLNLNFKTLNPSCDENYLKRKYIKLNYTPEKISIELSKNKANSISNKINNKLVLGSDTIISLQGRMVEKAKNIGEAKKKIKKMSGKIHTIVSSAAVYYNKKLIWKTNQKTKVKIRNLRNADIEKYLEICGPQILNSTGCYQIEKNGPMIIESIEGDFFNVMGLPLFPFLEFLTKNDLYKPYDK